MTAPTRAGGWGRIADGSVLTWSVADGRKGRRWREVVSRDAATVHALLLETDPAGRFSHLELARADGLWTFHPEPDGTLHGNHVRPGEPDVRHVVGWRFTPDDAMVVEGSPISLAAIAWARSVSLAAGSSVDVAGVIIRAGGALDAVPSLRIERLTGARWRVGGAPPVEIDDAGLPVLEGGATTSLERS